MNKGSPNYHKEEKPGHKLHYEVVSAATKASVEMIKKFGGFLEDDCLKKMKAVEFNAIFDTKKIKIY